MYTYIYTEYEQSSDTSCRMSPIFWNWTGESGRTLRMLDSWIKSLVPDRFPHQK